MDRVASCTGWVGKNYDPEYYKIVFMSSAGIGVPFLQELKNDKRFDVVGVVSMPDAASGRWMQMKENIIKSEAKKIFGIPPTPFNKGGDDDEFSNFIQTPNKINPEKSEEGKEFSEWLQLKNPDFVVVIAYGKIIPQSILDIPNFWSINVHGSLLPEYRGASPLQSVFLDNKKETGLTIMKMDAGLDTGNMIDKLKFKIPFERTVKDLIEKIQAKWPKFLNETLWKYGKKILWEEFQDEKKASHCKKIEKEDGLIDIHKDTLESIYSKYRAYFLWPKIYFTITHVPQESAGKGGEGDSSKSKRVIIEKLILNEKAFEDNKEKMLFDGKILNECVEEIILKPEGKKWMSWESFVAGYVR